MKEHNVILITMHDHADIAPRLVHTRPLVPSVADGVVAADGVEVVAAIEAPDHVNQVVERAEPVVRARREVHVDGEEPAVGPMVELGFIIYNNYF